VADNEEAVRLARALRARGDLVDVVPGHRTVLATWAGGEAPSFDGVRVDSTRAPVEARLVEVPVVYDGPDLAAVAQLVGVSPEEVAARHAAGAYIVAFLGFAPGFAYLLGGDELLHVPRLESPRERVPAGSVAIAGPYSAVYPGASPGGWRLLGRTELVLFDPGSDDPALLAPGDRVRFLPA
jgi:KipI family sensor histidine kinase inhibitor